MSASEALTWQIINQAWTKAEALSTDLQGRLDDAQTAVSGSIIVPTVPVDPIDPITEPNINIPTEAEAPDIHLFREYNDEIIDKLVDLYANYISTYLPTNASLNALAESWLSDQINNGGSGVNAAVEAQIFERDRSRITGEATRALADIEATWATKRFPIPTGAMQYQTAQVEYAKLAELGKSSRETAIKSFEVEVGMVKFAIEKAHEARFKALGAARDYIATMAGSQNTSTQLVTNRAAMQNGLISAVAGLLNARTNAADTVFKAGFATSRLQQEAALAAAEISKKQMEKRGDIAVAAADSVARQTSALLNNLHTSVGVQGQERF